MPWRCPNSSAVDRHHVLHIDRAATSDRDGDRDGDVVDDPNPFVRYDRRFAWAAHAARHGLDRAARRELVDHLDRAVRGVAGVGFTVTPFDRSDAISTVLGFEHPGGVYVKDETGSVGGSHKARHLASILLHLLVLERIEGSAPHRRPRLAIASCGNAALGAAVLARAVDWPLDVYVPVWMSDGFGARLDALGATIHRCERRATDPAGDPAMLRFREAVDAGSVPFTVQGPENAMCLDGGRTIGWEIAEQTPVPIDRCFLQVGGGAFAASVGAGLGCGSVDAPVVLPVQAAGCAPLARAWARAGGMTADVARRWSELMTPWAAPSSLADGILDDETYDWLGVFAAMGAGGRPIVVTDDHIVEALEIAEGAGFAVSATGVAGLAGVVAVRAQIPDDERLVVVMTGTSHPPGDPARDPSPDPG
jgi:threonine dehydratase